MKTLTLAVACCLSFAGFASAQETKPSQETKGSLNEKAVAVLAQLEGEIDAARPDGTGRGAPRSLGRRAHLRQERRRSLLRARLRRRAGSAVSTRHLATRRPRRDGGGGRRKRSGRRSLRAAHEVSRRHGRRVAELRARCTADRRVVHARHQRRDRRRWATACRSSFKSSNYKPARMAARRHSRPHVGPHHVRQLSSEASRAAAHRRRRREGRADVGADRSGPRVRAARRNSI